MSCTNRSRDRDGSGRLKRAHRGPNIRQTTPSWWTQIYSHRPQRHENRRLCREIAAGCDLDSTAWPLGSRKPHTYYW